MNIITQTPLVSAYAFNERGEISKARTFKTLEEIRDWLRAKYCSICSFGIDTLTRSGHYREAAIDYNFRPYLVKYLVQYPDGQLQSAFAPTKGELRRVLALSRSAHVWLFPHT